MYFISIGFAMIVTGALMVVRIALGENKKGKITLSFSIDLNSWRSVVGLLVMYAGTALSLYPIWPR